MSIKKLYYETVHFFNHYYYYNDFVLWVLRNKTNAEQLLM